jgi:hypothetical protein
VVRLTGFLGNLCRMEEWVKHFIAEERQRDEGRRREAAAAASRADYVGFHLHRILDALADRVARDVELFSREFPDRGLDFHRDPLSPGFIVRRESYPEASLTVTPDLSAGTIAIGYVFASQTGTVKPKAQTLELGGETIDTLHFRNDAEQHAFRTVAQLSEYLLVPVFTGRPR